MILSCFTNMTTNALLSYVCFQIQNLTLTWKRYKAQPNPWVIYQYPIYNAEGMAPAQVKGNDQHLSLIQRPAAMLVQMSPFADVPYGQSPKHFALL